MPSTGISVSEALIFESFNSQCDKTLFIESTEKKSNFCTQHVLNLYFSGDSMNSLSSYCGLKDSKMRASDTDLPILGIQN